VFAQSGPGGSEPELSGRIEVTAAFTLFSDGQCNASPTASGCDVWAVAEDMQPPPDGPNRSPEAEFRELNSTGGGETVCPVPSQLARRLKPEMALIGNSPGFRQGTIKVDANGTTFSQTFAALNSKTPGSAGVVALQVKGLVVPLQGSNGDGAEVAFSTARLPPGNIQAVLRSTVMVADLKSSEGRKLSLAYQVWDGAWHSQVQVAGAQVIPVIEYISNRPSSQPAEIRLPACSGFSEDTGLGQCDLLVAAGAFPAYGSPAASATVRLEVRVDGATATVGESFPLELRAAPDYPPLLEIGVVGTVPTRALHPGEEFTVSLEANTQAAALKEWFIPIYYDTAILTYVRSSPSSIWNALIETDEPSEGYLGLNCPGARSSATSAQRRGSAVDLGQVTFQVRQQTAAGAAASALRIGSDSAPVALVSDTSLGASINELQIGQIRDRRGGVQYDAELQVVAVVQRGLLAFASISELFNTAVLDGGSLGSQLTAAVVFSWYRQPDAPPAGGSLTCSVPAPTTAFSVRSSAQGCALTVASSNTGGVAQQAVRLSSGSLQADVRVTVWYPLSAVIRAEDPILNRVLDGTSAQDCDGDHPYQRTVLVATASWGGVGLETLSDIDITPLVSFVSEDETVLMIDGAMAQGISVGGPVGVSMQPYGALQASTEVSVTDETVCIVGVNVVAFTGATVIMAPGLPVTPFQRLTVSFAVHQVLVKENDLAMVRAYATFSDGSVQDVTSDATFLSTRPEYMTILPRSGDDNQQAEVTAELGSPGLCAPILEANWTVCSALVGSGRGTVSVQLPSPLRVQLMQAAPPKITRADDPAAAPPIQYETSSRLSVSLEFSDGQVLDFSQDERTLFAMGPDGSNLCSLRAQTDASPAVVTPAAGSTGPGPCTVSVSFPTFNNVSLVADTVVTVVVMERADLLLLHYDVASISAFAPTYSPASRAPQLRSIACSPGDYQQATVWAVGQLSDETRHDISGFSQYSSDSPDTVSFRANLGRDSLANRVRPLQAGSADLVATFSSFTSQTLTITAVSAQPATIDSIRMQGIIGGQGFWCTSGAGTAQCQTTFIGVKNSQATLQAEVELDDGYTYTAGVGTIFGASRESLDIVETPRLLSFASSVPSAIALAAWGDAELLLNHWAAVGITMESQAGCVPAGGTAATDSEQVYANLAAAELDLDLGQQYGLQFQSDPANANSAPRAINPGDRFTVPVVLNSASDFVEVFDIHINFDDALIQVASQADCEVGSSWPNRETWVCVANSPPNQVRINGVDSNVVASMRSARVELARVTFTARAAGLAEITGLLVEVKQQQGQPLKDRPFEAGAGFVRIGDATTRRHLQGAAHSPNAARPLLRNKLAAPGNASKASVAGRALRPQRALLQSACTEEAARQVLGDINFDCIFDLAGDVLTMDLIFGDWVRSPSLYYAAQAELSVNLGPLSVNSGITAHQRASLDPMLRYYPGLLPSNPNYIPRADGSPVPPLQLYTGTPVRPGAKDDKLLMQLIKADVQYFLQGVYITPPSRASKVLEVEIELRNGDGSAITSSDGIFVQVEVNSTQQVRWTNPGAEGGQSNEGNAIATATYVGDSRWRAVAAGGPAGPGGDSSAFVVEPLVGLAFLVLSLDSNGAPIATSFYPYYGSSQKQLYVPAEAGEETYKDSFTPYTIFSIEATCTRFLPGFPTVVDIQDTAMQLQARLDSPVFRLHYIAVSAAASVTPTPAQVTDGESLPNLQVLQSGVFDAGEAGLFQANVSGLPATSNVTVWVSIEETEGELGEGVVSIAGILMRDTSPPSFSVIELTDAFPVVDEALGTFSMSVRVQMDEPSSVYWAVYRNLTCITGDPTLQEIREGATLQPPVCQCSGDEDDCAVVDFGTFDVDADGDLEAVIEIAGDLSPLPFDELINAPESEMRCFSGSFGPEASDTYHLYLWSGDDLPTHNSVEPRCADRAGAGNGPSTCGAVEVSCAQPPVAEGDGQTAVGTINWQEEPFYLVTINQTLTDPANNGVSGVSASQERPLKVQFSLESSEAPIFTLGPNLPDAQQGPDSLWMEFELDRPGLVTFVVSNFTASGEDVESGNGGGSLQVGNGRTVVLNDSPGNVRMEVDITACAPNALLPQQEYLVQVVARDKHGRTQGRVIRRLASTQAARRRLG